MFKISKRKFILCMIMFSICLSMLTVQVFSLSFEQEVSRRKSIRSYTSENIPRQQFLDVLWAAYGYTIEQKTVPQIGYEYSLVVFTVNETGSYRYIPETNSLAVHDMTVNKETLRTYYSDWPSNAKEVLVIVWDKTIMNNQYFAAAEAGCLAQNVHLAASSLNLGTCVVGSINSDGIRNTLQLPTTFTPLLVMPLSYSTEQYQNSAPKYDIMTGNLPIVQYSESSFVDAVNNIVFSQQWSTEPLSLQELSQLLWAAYGYSNTNHRTTPSSFGIYPLIIYVSNATGVYQYVPETHSVTKILDGNKRFEIANAFSGQTWAADAPTMLLIGYDSAYNEGNTGDGGVFSHMFMGVNTGCVIQQLILEASVLNLRSNILKDDFGEWNGAAAQELRNSLGLSTSIIPLHAIPVGRPKNGDVSPPTIGSLSYDPELGTVKSNQDVTISVEVTDEGVGVNQVRLSYSADEGQTWTNVVMTKSSTDIYTGEISGFEEGRKVHYKIVAYDNNNNVAVEDNAGEYHSYMVIPEFQNFVILMFIISTAFAVIFAKRETAKSCTQSHK